MGTKPRKRDEGKLTPIHRIPTGHERKRSESIMGDKRNRKDARSSIRAKGWSE